MKEITVTYRISEDQERRLYELLPEYNEGLEEEYTIEDVFSQIMTIGSAIDIEEKLTSMERIFRLRKLSESSDQN